MSTHSHTPPRRDGFHSFRKDRARLLSRRRILFAVLCVSLLLLALRTPAEGYLSEAIHVFARPLYVLKLSVSDSFGNLAHVFTSKRSLAEENGRLKDALDAVVLDAYSIEALRAENAYLKSVFGRHTEQSLLLARVLASPGELPYDTLVIDIGEEDGLLLGDRVFYDGDFVIGEVSKLFDRSAIVTLYSGSGNELRVRIGASSTPALALGEGGGSFRVILPKGENVQIGDFVNIPDLAIMPVGIVEAVERTESSSLQDVYFRWPFNVATLAHVYIEVPMSPATTQETP